MDNNSAQENLPYFFTLVITLKNTLGEEALITVFSPAKQKTPGRQELALPQMPNFLTSIVNDIAFMIALSATQIPGTRRLHEEIPCLEVPLCGLR